MQKNVAAMQIQKDAIFNLIAKNQFNSKQIIQISQPIIIDFFSMHSYIVVISYTMYFNDDFLSLGVVGVSSTWKHRKQRHLAAK